MLKDQLNWQNRKIDKNEYYSHWSTCRRPWQVQGAYDSDLTIHSRTTLWYKERTVTTQAGSLTTVEGASLCMENSKESKQDEFHIT